MSFQESLRARYPTVPLVLDSVDAIWQRYLRLFVLTQINNRDAKRAQDTATHEDIALQVEQGRWHPGVVLTRPLWMMLAQRMRSFMSRPHFLSLLSQEMVPALWQEFKSFLSLTEVTEGSTVVSGVWIHTPPSQPAHLFGGRLLPDAVIMSSMGSQA